MTIPRNIIHIDMDAFYASVEQRDHPEYRGKPVVVGGGPERGVVAAASYEAREYGIHSAMPSKTALHKCPDLIFIKPRFPLYRAISKQIRQIFFDYTELVEPLSLDEAYLDVTPKSRYLHAAIDMAREIRKRIKAKTMLTASAGVSFNKFLAKLASDKDKPDGLTVIPKEEALDFIAQLPIEKFHGIGQVTAKHMRQHGIETGADLRSRELHQLVKHFGKRGQYYYNIARGIDHREVNPNRTRKSLGAETTFRHDLSESDEMLSAIKPLAEKVLQRLEQHQTYGRTVTLKVKFADFQQITRSETVSQPIHEQAELMDMIKKLLEKSPLKNRKVRLLGVAISNLETRSNRQQLKLSI